MSRVLFAFSCLLLLSGSHAMAQERESLIDPAHYRGLAADRRAYRVGDLLTVHVIEATRARSQAATDASSTLGLDAGLASPSTDYQASLGLSGRNAGVVSESQRQSILYRVAKWLRLM
jgi:flagellar basal body L-ring protein FlgH